MPPKKTPTSSFSVFQLLAIRVRHPVRAIIRKTRPTNVSPDSPISKLPQEIIEMIISHLIYDFGSLRMCCLTCYSWYIAAAPPLHRALVIDTVTEDRKLRWPTLIHRMYKLGLLPLAKDLKIFGDVGAEISPRLLNFRVLRRFRALSNVTDLRLECLDIPKFLPKTQHYFGHFLPTVRSLTLGSPKGSRRQIIFFIGLFQDLEDLMLHNMELLPGEIEPVDDPTLVPNFKPPLGGQLVAWNLKRVDLIQQMINLFGEIRFTAVNLFDVNETRLLLRACKETLQTLQLHPTDPLTKSSLSHFDLSRNKSLKEVEVLAGSIDAELRYGTTGSASELLKHALSTVQPSLDLKVALLYATGSFRGVQKEKGSKWPHLREMTDIEKAEEAMWHHRRFDLVRELHKVRRFDLLLCANVWDPVGEYTVRMLKEAVEVAKKGKMFDEFASEPTVTYNPRWDLHFQSVEVM